MKMIMIVLIGLMAIYFAYSIIPSECEPVEICDESGCQTFEYEFDGVGCSLVTGAKSPEEVLTYINYQTNEIDLGNGKFAQSSYLGFENYKDGGEFKPIDMTLIDYGTYWKTTESVYYPTIPKYADEWSEFNNVFEGNNHSIKVRPVAEHVEGIVNESNVILYPDAFGEGFDLEVTAYNGHLLRKVIIREPQDKKLSFDFEIDIDNKLSYKSVDKNKSKEDIELDKNLKEKSIEFEEGETPTIIYPMRVWDSNNLFEYIDSKIYEKDGKLYLQKEISKEFLENAVYPVYTDDDTGATLPGTGVDDDTVGTETWDSPYWIVIEGGIASGLIGSGAISAPIFDEVRVVLSDGSIGSVNNGSQQLTSSQASYYFGANDYLWGENWEYTDINHINFGAVFSMLGVGYPVNYKTHYLKATNFSFAIPAGATIDGIYIEINGYKGGAATRFAYMYYLKITVYYTEVTDTCTPTAGAIWEVTCSDNCTISSSTELGGNGLYFTEVGTFQLDDGVVINDIGDFSLSNNCNIILGDNSELVI